MAQKQQTPTHQDIVALRNRIDQWRQNRTKNSPMPEELWRQAVALARQQGLGPVSRGLRVDYGKLKIRYDQLADHDSGPIPTFSDGFVEIDRAHLASPNDTTVTLELSAPDGAKLVVRLNGREPVDLLGLAQAFWRREP